MSFHIEEEEQQKQDVQCRHCYDGSRWYKRFQNECGQATVEAAFVLPVLFITILLLLQPGIVLYDRVVMNSAASEGCRYLATYAPSEGMGEQRAQEIIGRRLGAIPEQDLFHIHNPCSYEIELTGDETSEEISVRITNAIEPLPLLGIAESAFGMLDGANHFSFSVEAHAYTQPAWVHAQSTTPNDWVHSRDDGR